MNLEGIPYLEMPKAFLCNSVECFSEVNKQHKEGLLLLNGFLLELTQGKYHVNAAACWPETTLRFWKDIFSYWPEAM